MGKFFQKSSVGQKFVPNLGTWEVSKLKLAYVKETRKNREKEIEKDRRGKKKKGKEEGRKRKLERDIDKSGSLKARKIQK